MSERKSPYSFSTRTIWNFSGAMMTLPSRASNSSTLCGTSGNCSRDLVGDLLEQAVGRLLDRVLRGAGDPLAGLAGQVEGVAGRLADRPPLDDPQADRAVLADHPAGVVVGPAGGDPDDVQVQLAAEVRRHARDRVDRPVDDREVEPPPEDLVGALLGRDRRVLQRDLVGRDRLDRLVVDRLPVRPAVLQGQVDRLEVEVDRQGLGQGVDGPRQLGADAVAQQLGDLVRRAHGGHGSLWDGPRTPGNHDGPARERGGEGRSYGGGPTVVKSVRPPRHRSIRNRRGRDPALLRESSKSADGAGTCHDPLGISRRGGVY